MSTFASTVRSLTFTGVPAYPETSFSSFAANTHGSTTAFPDDPRIDTPKLTTGCSRSTEYRVSEPSSFIGAPTYPAGGPNGIEGQQ